MSRTWLTGHLNPRVPSAEEDPRRSLRILTSLDPSAPRFTSTPLYNLAP